MLFSNFLEERASLFGGSFGLSGLDGLRDLSDEIDKDVVNVDLLFGGGLHEGAVESLCKALTLLHGYHSLVFQVAFIPDQHHRNRIAVLNTEDLFAEFGKVVESGLCHNRVSHSKALAILHVQITHCGKLFSSCSIQNFQHVLISVDFQGFSITVLDSRIIFLNENSLDELHRQSGFSDTSGSKDDNFIVWHYK